MCVLCCVPTLSLQLECVVSDTQALKERQETPDSPEALTCIPSLQVRTHTGGERPGGGGSQLSLFTAPAPASLAVHVGVSAGMYEAANAARCV